MAARFGQRWNVRPRGPLERQLGRRFSMTRLFLATGVAALAIAMPASARPGEHGGGNSGDRAATAPRGGGNAGARGGGQPLQGQLAPRGGGGGSAFPAAKRRGCPRLQVQRPA